MISAPTNCSLKLRRAARAPGQIHHVEKSNRVVRSVKLGATMICARTSTTTWRRRSVRCHGSRIFFLRHALRQHASHNGESRSGRLARGPLDKFDGDDIPTPRFFAAPPSQSLIENNSLVTYRYLEMIHSRTSHRSHVKFHRSLPRTCSAICLCSRHLLSSRAGRKNRSNATRRLTAAKPFGH